MQSALRLFEFVMHSNAQTPVTLHSYNPGAWGLQTRMIAQSKADVLIKSGIMIVALAF
jgi:hypothetical protein